MYHEILVPTDGSHGARRGIDHGLQLAREHGARVHVLYVVDERRHSTPALSSEELSIEHVEDRADETLEAVATEAEGMGVDAVTACRRGHPARSILDYARENDIDLIVMGRHGASGLSHLHLGSCTEEVVKSGQVPTLPV